MIELMPSPTIPNTWVAPHAIKVSTTMSDVVSSGPKSVEGCAETAASVSEGQFALPGVITLPANTAYYLVSQETPGGDRWATSNTTITTTPAATCNGALLSNASSWTLRPPANSTFGPVNLKYQ